ncbi:hypothetical protein RND81_03G137500 [Saponaria officinalis]|uniref:VQ domain-containing protein n=1 Tax=Saponaria officinalis TaxID=3572 RepID=A0AAW1M0A2_SAPOF
MDVYNNFHHQMKAKKSRKSRGIVKKPCGKDGMMKVVYISTPLKVKTSASNFRQLVQELTGRESDVVRIMEKRDFNNNYNNINNYINIDINNNTRMIHDNNHNVNNSYNSNDNIIGDCYGGQVGLMKTTTRDEDETIQISGILDDKTSFSSSSEEFIDQFDGVYMREQQSFGQFDDPTLLYDSIYNQIDALSSY